MIITGSTRVFTILSHPSTHVTAPLIFNHLFSSMGLDMVYIAHDVLPGSVPHALKSFAGWENLGGFNVTIPHKESVAGLLTDLCPVSRRIGVVNTVVRLPDGSLRGANTDGIGALLAIGPAGGASCLVMGAGGASRAIVHALLEAGASKVLILNRSPEGARRLCALMGSEAVRPYAGDPLEEMDIVVQATPVSDAIPFRLDLSRFRPATRILETIMRPTALAEKARELGLRLIQGQAMLYHQTRENFRILTGLDLPQDALDSAFASIGYHRP
ncbi:MAG TPA: shikimate dehydrogenase [Deltaproteobacteria bacterium]|nr:shikimate dehydrogenase [Deltaproteobacteria bacterium]